MRVLILGCNGMLGHMLTLYLLNREHTVTGFAREKSPFVDTIVSDIHNISLLKDTVSAKYDIIINCIGLLNQYADNNQSEAVFINSYIPHILADFTKNMKTKVIQVSTDCVFSGESGGGGYREYDLRDGRTFYDRSKALGEIDDDKNITLRQSIIGPDTKPSGIGLLNWFMQQNNEVDGFTNVIWTGQTTLQLAKTIEAISTTDIYGIINSVPDTSISKYDLLCLFNKYVRRNKIKIIPKNQPKINKSLKSLRKDFSYSIPNYESMIMELASWMKSHRLLYPHYDLEE